jgi:hypothetical protein
MPSTIRCPGRGPTGRLITGACHGPIHSSRQAPDRPPLSSLHFSLPTAGSSQWKAGAQTSSHANEARNPQPRICPVISQGTREFRHPRPSQQLLATVMLPKSCAARCAAGRAAGHMQTGTRWVPVPRAAPLAPRTQCCSQPQVLCRCQWRTRKQAMSRDMLPPENILLIC